MILNLLGINGRISNKKIAHTIGLTTKRVKMRIDKMFSAKVIERFIALIIHSILGYTVTCAFVPKKEHDKQRLD